MVHFRIEAKKKDFDKLSKILNSINLTAKVVYDNKKMSYIDLYLPTTSKKDYKLYMDLEKDGIEVMKG